MAPRFANNGSRFIQRRGGTPVHSYELLYFPARGRAEQIRLLFAFKGVPFTDATADWPAQKDGTPFGQLPVLIERGDDGELVLPESGAILRHLARRFDMYGSTLHEHALCDALADFVADARSRYVPVAFTALFKTTPEAIEAYYKALPRTLGLLERALLRSKNPAAGWFIGDAVTFADVAAFDHLDAVEQLKPGILDGLPGLDAFMKRFRALPTVAPFLANRTTRDPG
jgi:glutathione S-transferase